MSDDLKIISGFTAIFLFIYFLLFIGSYNFYELESVFTLKIFRNVFVISVLLEFFSYEMIED